MLRVTPLGSQIGLLAWLAHRMELPSTPSPCARALTHGSVVGFWHRPDSCRSSLRAPLSFPLRPSLGHSATVAVPDGGAFSTEEGSQRLPALLFLRRWRPPKGQARPRLIFHRRELGKGPQLSQKAQPSVSSGSPEKGSGEASPNLSPSSVGERGPTKTDFNDRYKPQPQPKLKTARSGLAKPRRSKWPAPRKTGSRKSRSAPRRLRPCHAPEAAMTLTYEGWG